jgi:hypothetical protein
LLFLHELTAHWPRRAPVPLRICFGRLVNVPGVKVMVLSSLRILARPLYGLAFAALLGPFAAWAEAAPDAIAVNVDQAKLVKLRRHQLHRDGPWR